MQHIWWLFLLVLVTETIRGAPTDSQPAPPSASADTVIQTPAIPRIPAAAISTADQPPVISTADQAPVISTADFAALAPSTSIGDKSDPATANPDEAIKTAEESLKKLREQLKDAVAAIVAPAANVDGQIKAPKNDVNVYPEGNTKPTVEVTPPKTYKEIIGQLITDLIQIPIVLLHAFGEAIAGLSGTKVPSLVYPGASGYAGISIQGAPK